MIILIMILKKWAVRKCSGPYWLGVRSHDAICKHCNEPSGSIKNRVFHEQLSNN
jgi:hypothetical protein